jgi:hypothetical protein
VGAPCRVFRLRGHLHDVVVGIILEVDGVAEGDFFRGARLTEAVGPRHLHRRGMCGLRCYRENYGHEG